MAHNTRRTLVSPWLVALCPMLLVACGSSQTHTVQVLNQRLERQVAPDVEAHRATVQALPNGAQVTLLDQGLFNNTADALDNRNSDPRANVIEGLLDPALMRIQIADNSSLPANQRAARVANVTEYFRVVGLGLSIDPTEPPPAPSPGLQITISVQCPDRTPSWSGYSNGRDQPRCD